MYKPSASAPTVRINSDILIEEAMTALMRFAGNAARVAVRAFNSRRVMATSDPKGGKHVAELGNLTNSASTPVC